MRNLRKKVLYQNENGKICCYRSVVDGGVRYVLFNSHGELLQELRAPFSVADYL